MYICLQYLQTEAHIMTKDNHIKIFGNALQWKLSEIEDSNCY